MSFDVTYVVPLKWNDTSETAEMTDYLERLSAHLDVIVVDGSPLEVFEEHSAAWSSFVKHVRPDPDLRFLNGKVDGVTTGVRAAGTEKVIVADDDIRFDEFALARMVELLDAHDLVLGQSYLRPTPWHAQWETARILLNRAVGVQFSVSMGLRRSLFLEMGGYDGDVMFENLELMRSMLYAGARIAAPADLFVKHLAPDRKWFWSQRVRQAYDDFTLPGRMTLWLSLAPLTVRAIAKRRWGGVAAAALGSIVVAELGRRRGGGAAFYPPTAPLFAPAWLAERALCSWAAVWQRLVRGGIPYRDGVIPRAATPRRELRPRIEERVRRARGQ
jgi:hypothetical protein